MATEQSHGQHGHGEEGHPHVLPYSVYFSVYFALLFLTLLTVQVSFWNLGPLSLPVAMLVAMVKAALVVGFFMHLRYDNKFLSLVFFGSIVFLLVFFAFTMFDLTTRGTLLNREEGTFALRNEKRLKASEGKSSAAAGNVYAHAAKASKTSFKSASQGTSVFAPKVDNSFPADAPKASAAILALGQSTFAKTCASCHGAKGAGDGMPLPVKPRNFSKGEFNHGGTPKSIFNVITNGSPKTPLMVAWGKILPAKTRWALVHYIQSLNTTKKPAARTAPAHR